MNNPRSALATFCTRSPYRVAYRSARGWAYTDTSPKVERPDHVYVPEQKIALLKHFELAREPADPRRLILPWHEKHLAPTLKLQSLAALGDASRTLHGERLRVALSPTHRRPPRRWPVERYAALADVLTSQHGADVIWLWGPGEEDFVRDVARMCKEATWFAPKTSFRELAAVIANCDLFIGNSNGPSHVAVAVDTPSFQLHGPTSLRAWCPLTPEHQGIEASDLAALSVEQVLAALPFDVVRQHMAKRRKGGAFTLRLAWNQPR